MSPTPQIPPAAADSPLAASADCDVQIYFSQATETGCRVHAVWPAPAAPTRPDPQAFLYGPESPYATTLRTRHPISRRPGAADKPAEAWIAEPCFWTPAAPYVYRYEFHFSPPAATVTGLFGIRRLGVERGHLVLDRKHWVLRGATARLAAGQAFPLADWHDAPLAAVVDRPADALCEQASRLGVLLVARVPAGDDVAAELRRLARWPAVGIAILAAAADGDDPRRHARNMLLAQSVPADAPLEPAAWAHLLFCEVADPAAFARQAAGCRLPIVAVRPLGDWQSPAEARAACDRLQRGLAAEGLQAAGYVV